MDKKLKKRIVLLDAHAIIHRAYHGMPNFYTSKGEPSGALFGICSMVLKLATELKPDYVIACFDLPKPTFRHIAYKEYKAGRSKGDDELVSQIKKSRSVFESFSIPIYEAEGFEADDCLGTIVHDLKKQKDVEIIIASGDMDTMQLVDGDKVRVYTFKKGITDTILYNEEEVNKKYGFGPQFVADYKGLAGDSSDNIIGITGIGAKTATILIQNFGGVEDIYKKLKANEESFKIKGLTPRIINLLKEGEDEAVFSKVLATIRLDAPINFSIPNVLWKDSLDLQKIEEVLKLYEFNGLRKRVGDLLGGDKKIEEKELVSEKDIKFKEAQIYTWLLNSEKTDPDLTTIKNEAGADTFSESYDILKERVYKDLNLKNIFEKIEKPIITVIEEISSAGVLIDQKYLKFLETEYKAVRDGLQKEIFYLVGKEFNIASPKQLGEVLFDDLKLEAKGLKKTAGGARSTNIDTLLKLKDTHPSVDKIIHFREVDKLLNTYITPIPTQIKEDGRVHSTYIQTGAATGRFASKDPSVQNIPAEENSDKNIRNMFIAGENKILVSLDFSQIELRVAAMLSGDVNFLKIFQNKEDVHSEVASYIFKVKKEDVTKDMRRVSKAINFGILYGMGVSALASGMERDRKEAQAFYDDYRYSFKTLISYLEKVKETATRTGFTETLFGRRRNISLIRSGIPFLRAQGERMAINAPIQGTAADMLRLSLIEIQESLKSSFGEKSKIIMQVHDEIILECEIGHEEKASFLVKEIMENILIKNKDKFIFNVEIVPIEVSIKKGFKWGDLK